MVLFMNHMPKDYTFRTGAVTYTGNITIGDQASDVFSEDLPFEETLRYIVTMVNLGYGVTVNENGGQASTTWNPFMGFSIPVPERDDGIIGLKQNREKGRKITSIEIFTVESGL